MIDTLRRTLRGLRGSISARIENAYRERDSADSDVEMAYAEGKAHAFSVAESEIIRAEDRGAESAARG